MISRHVKPKTFEISSKVIKNNSKDIRVDVKILVSKIFWNRNFSVNVLI